MGMFSDRFPTAARHWGILRESWRNQNRAEKTARRRSDHEFLPAALEIMEKPPSVGLRWLLLTMCGVFVVALVWSFIGRVDVVAVASGKTVPAGNVKVVQPLEIGSVRAIHVRNGQRVKAGQLLIELDPTMATADEAQSTQTLNSAKLVQARNDALLAHLQGRASRFSAPPGTPASVVATEQQYVRTAIAEYEAQISGLRQARAEKAAELAGTQARIAKLMGAKPFIAKQLDAREKLAERGYYSKLKLLEYQQAAAEQEKEVDVEQANADAARAAIGTIDAQVAQLRETFGKAAVTALVDANDRAGLAGEELRKSEARRGNQELRSPVDGVVQQLAVTTVGGVVQPAQALMVIVPCSGDGRDRACTNPIEVEAFVQNRDIGFVQVGERVAVKLEAFNFTDFGLIDGVVEDISRDAIDQSQAPAGSQRDESGRPVQAGLVYAARIRLKCSAVDTPANPLCARVGPGMAVQAEIKTGTRRVIDYLLSPIAKAMDEAGRER